MAPTRYFKERQIVSEKLAQHGFEKAALLHGVAFRDDAGNVHVVNGPEGVFGGKINVAVPHSPVVALALIIGKKDGCFWFEHEGKLLPLASVVSLDHKSNANYLSAEKNEEGKVKVGSFNTAGIKHFFKVSENARGESLLGIQVKNYPLNGAGYKECVAKLKEHFGVK